VAANLSNVMGVVFLQVLHDSVHEIEWLYRLSKENSIIKGVVAGIDVANPKLSDTLSDIQEKYDRILVGVRHILDFEADGCKWLESDAVETGVKTLARHGLSFDLLLRPPLIKSAIKLVKKCPGVKFVVDHIAKPYVKDQTGFEEWRQEMKELSEFPNVWCKISGLVTEADDAKQKLDVDLFLPLVQHIWGCFGEDRVMFGSDWPVCRLVHFEHSHVVKLYRDILVACGASEGQLRKYFYRNTCNFYGLQI